MAATWPDGQLEVDGVEPKWATDGRGRSDGVVAGEKHGELHRQARGQQPGEPAPASQEQQHGDERWLPPTIPVVSASTVKSPLRRSQRAARCPANHWFTCSSQ